MSAISVRDVTKTYGDVTALDDVSLTIEAGTTFGLIGTNGAGKTTLFRLLVGHERPDSGRIEVAGYAPDAGPAVRRQVGYLPETAGFHPSLTGREAVRFHAEMRGVSADDREGRIDAVLRTVGLAEAADRRVGGYSNGMHRRLGLATILLTRPRVLLLDEPTAALDPRGVSRFYRTIERIRAENDLTIVVSSHDLTDIERLCDHAAILDRGRVRAHGALDDLRSAGRATVTVRLASGDPAAVRERLVDRFPGVTARSAAASGTLEFVCPRGVVYDVLSWLHDTYDLDGFEVHEPGLRATFDDAIDTDADAPSDPGSGVNGGEPA